MSCAGNSPGDPLRFISRTGGTNSVADTTTGYTTGVWYHACAVGISATSRDVYLNGGSKGSNTTSSTPSGLDTTSLGVSTRNTTVNVYDGRIAEAAIWNVALNADEVLALANRVSPQRVRPASLLAYWPLYGIGSPEPDCGSNSTRYNMTVTGATQFAHAPVMPPFGVLGDWSGAFTAAAAPGGAPTFNAAWVGNANTFLGGGMQACRREYSFPVPAPKRKRRRLCPKEA